MHIYDAFLVLLGRKPKTESHKNLWITYADFKTSHPYRLFSDSNFFLLGMIIISLQSPLFWFVVFLCCYFRFLNRFGREINHREDKKYIEYSLVNFIQLHHNESLKKYLMAEPALIDSLYKRRSLLHWSIHYKNYEAHRMILALMKERLRRKDQSVA